MVGGRKGAFWTFLWFGSCSCFVCAQIQFQSDLVFVWLHHGHRIALSSLGV